MTPNFLLGPLVAAAIAGSAAQADSESSVGNAYAVCAVLDTTGLLSEPCSVSGWASSVDIRLDTSGAEARKICAGIVDLAAAQNVRFDDGWGVRVYSPFSGDSTLARCRF